MTRPPDIDIRPAVAGDFTAIVALAKGSVAAAYGSFISAERLKPWAEGDAMDGYVTANIAHMLVAADGDGLAGVVSMEGDLIGLLWVAPGKRSQGIGSRLMTTAEARMRRAGHSRLRVKVFEPNVGAIRFYERHGYARRGVEPEPNAGVNQVLMVKG